MPDTPRVVRECLDSIPDPEVSRGLTLFNCLMSGLAVFRLKIPSLLEFDELVRVNESSAQTRNHPATIMRVLLQNFGIPDWRTFHEKVSIHIATRRRPRRT